MTVESKQAKRTKLRKLLVSHFDLQDLRDLCFDLEVDFDSLGARDNKAEKVRELISYMEKRRMLPELIMEPQKLDLMSIGLYFNLLRHQSR